MNAVLMLQVCPKCRAEVTSEGKFCARCGAVIAPVPQRMTSLGDEATLDGEDADDKLVPSGPRTGGFTSLGAEPTLEPQDDGIDFELDGLAPLNHVENDQATQVLGAKSADQHADLQLDASSDSQPVVIERRDATRKPVELEATADYLVELLPEGQLRPWKLHRPYYSVGRAGAKISLGDPRVSKRHLALARLGPDWIVVNRTENRRMRVNGWNLRQATLHDGDVIRIGNTWLVFVAGSQRAAEMPLRAFPSAGDESVSHTAIPARSSSYAPGATIDSLDDEDERPGFVSLSIDSRQVATSQGQPLLIGSHLLCKLRLDDGNVAPVQCQLIWLPDGPTLLDLGGGTLVDGRPIKSRVLHNKDRVTIGSLQMSINVAGDPDAPAVDRLRHMRTATRAVSLTAIYGPHCGSTTILPPEKQLILGRKAKDGLSLPNEAQISKRHLELCLQADSLQGDTPRPVVQLKDLGSSNGTLINRVPVEGQATATIGDVIQFGRDKHLAPTALLLHYELTLDGWP